MIDPKVFVICGFPGVGKSYAQSYSSSKVADCESSSFHYIEVSGFLPRKEENKNWVHDYVDYIYEQSCGGHFQYILISSHYAVRRELDLREIPYICVVPEKRLKDIYLSNYIKRGNDINFVKQLYEHWEEWLDEIETHGAPVVHLKEGQYISTILD